MRPAKWRHAVGRRWFRASLARGLRVQARSGIVKVGSSYGGWFVPLSDVRPEWVVYSVGAGTDVTFDVGLISRSGCEVQVFDPTPAAIEHVGQLNEPRLHVHPWALWTRDEDIAMYLPRAGSGSLSAVNLQRTANAVRLPGRSLRSIMVELGHNRVDLLKVDIEGAEYDVVTPELMVDAGVRVLAIDVHPNVPARRAILFLRGFLAAGYVVVAREETDFTLVRDT
jgi:FkbM family methyltransferase